MSAPSKPFFSARTVASAPSLAEVAARAPAPANPVWAAAVYAPANPVWAAAVYAPANPLEQAVLRAKDAQAKLGSPQVPASVLTAADHVQRMMAGVELEERYPAGNTFTVRQASVAHLPPVEEELSNVAPERHHATRSRTTSSESPPPVERSRSDVLSVAETARALRIREGEARRWLRERGLVGNVAGRDRVVWGDVLEAMKASQPAPRPAPRALKARLPRVKL